MKDDWKLDLLIVIAFGLMGFLAAFSGAVLGVWVMK